VFSEFPTEISSLRTEGVIRGKFNDGSGFEAPIVGNVVFWIAPGVNEQKLDVDSMIEFVEAIEETQGDAVNLSFDSPSALKEHLQKIHSHNKP
jgi:hypothetical protein